MERLILHYRTTRPHPLPTAPIGFTPMERLILHYHPTPPPAPLPPQPPCVPPILPARHLRAQKKPPCQRHCGRLLRRAVPANSSSCYEKSRRLRLDTIT